MPHNTSTYENNKCVVLKHDTELNLVLILGNKICLFKETFANLKTFFWAQLQMQFIICRLLKNCRYLMASDKSCEKIKSKRRPLWQCFGWVTPFRIMQRSLHSYSYVQYYPSLEAILMITTTVMCSGKIKLLLFGYLWSF